MQKRAQAARVNRGVLIAILVLALASSGRSIFGCAVVLDHSGGMMMNHAVCDAEFTSHHWDTITVW